MINLRSSLSHSSSTYWTQISLFGIFRHPSHSYGVCPFLLDWFEWLVRPYQGHMEPQTLNLNLRLRLLVMRLESLLLYSFESWVTRPSPPMITNITFPRLMANWCAYRACGLDSQLRSYEC